MRQVASPRVRLDAIAIGGSAGSIEALGAVLPALPAGFHAALLVVLHLPRERPSLLCNIFRQRCALPVREAQDKEPVEPGTVYFAPPDYHLLVDSGPRLCLSADAPLNFSRPSIDVLFESAADEYGPRLMAVLLSGANSDGAWLARSAGRWRRHGGAVARQRFVHGHAAGGAGPDPTRSGASPGTHRRAVDHLA